MTIGSTTSSVTNTDIPGTPSNTPTNSGALVNVYAYASPTFSTTPISFGYLHVGATAPTANVAITNTSVAPTGYQDSLDATPTSTNSNVSGSGFTAVAAGSSQNVTVTASTSSPGSLAGTVNLGLVSNDNGVAGLSNSSLSGSVTTSGTVFSGLSTWAGTSTGGSWGTITGTTPDSSFINNWTQGAPGVTAGFTGTDTATFNNVAGQATQLVTLDGAAPNVNAINLNASSTSYTLAQGSGSNSITLSGIAPTINVLAGSHTISAPLVLGSNTTLAVTAAQKLVMSGQISGSSSLTNSGAGTTVLSNASGNTYSGGTSITAGTVYANNTSGSATGTGNVTVGYNDTVGTGTLAGSGNIGNATTRTTVSVNGGGTISSGALQTGAPGVVTGKGLTFTNTTINVAGDAPATLQFALGADTTSSGVPYDYANPSTNSTFMTLASGSTLNFAGVDAISLTDLTASNTLTLRTGTAYLLVAGTSDSQYTGLVTEQGFGATGTFSLDGNGYVLGVATGVGTLGSAGSYTPISISQFGADGTTPLTGSQIYAAPALYLNTGNLEVVPEPGTWALMLGGLALLIVIQRRRSKV